LHKIKNIFILFLLNLLFYLHSEELSLNFKNIINIDELNQKLIELDLTNISYNKYFELFVIVSEDYPKLGEYKVWFNDLERKVEEDLLKEFNTTDINKLSVEKQKKFAEELLLFIHNYSLSNYDEMSSRISDIIENKKFNCVSSSILYTIFLLKYNFKPIAIETKDHVFIEIKFADEDIDVETTNKIGFNPGEKKDVLDSFGKITGFTYVPKKNYLERKERSLKRLLLIVYHNLTNYYFKKGDSVKAANLSYIIYKGMNDKESYDGFITYFSNHIIFLSNKKDYDTIFNDINSFLSHFGLEEKIVNLRYEIIGKFINEFNDFKNYEKIEKFLLEQKNLFVKDKTINEKKFLEIYSYFVYKVTNHLSKNKNFNEAFDLIKRAKRYFNNPEFEKIFNNILVEIINNYTKKNDFDYLENIIVKLKGDFPEYINTIRIFEKSNILAKINKLTIDKKFEEAFKEIERVYNDYKDDNDFESIHINLYVKYIQNFYDNNDIENVIKYSDIALNIFRNNKIILNNYRAYLINFIIKQVNAKNFKDARQYLNIALSKFSDENILKDLDRKLKELNY